MRVFIATVADCGKFLALFELSWNERGQRDREGSGPWTLDGLEVTSVHVDELPADKYLC